MDNQPDLLDLVSFIRTYIPEYKFDQFNEKLLRQLGLWATRNEKFNGMEPGWHIDRGILLTGVPGVGKDEIFRILRKYMSYLGCTNGYESRVVWKYAKEFMKDKIGYACFDNDRGNLYYEELALTDENTGEVTREHIQNYGNKLLIGQEIIRIRYMQFKERGWQTHFSTNCTEDELIKVYGNRCIDRLAEMCNYMILTGKSKRGVLPPTFIKNDNIPAPPKARETRADEHDFNKRVLDDEYRDFCLKGTTSNNVALNYNLLMYYGCQVASEEEMLQLMEIVAPNFREEATMKRVSNTDREKNKEHFIWVQARKLAVEKFYQRLKEAGTKSIFEVIDVNINNVVAAVKPNE